MSKLSGMDRTMESGAIEVHGYQKINRVLLEPIEGERLIVAAGDLAAGIRDGLRGSVIESDLQCLCEREDGVPLLTGCGLKSQVLAALDRAGFPSDMLNVIRGWKGDHVSMSFEYAAGLSY